MNRFILFAAALCFVCAAGSASAEDGWWHPSQDLVDVIDAPATTFFVPPGRHVRMDEWSMLCLT